MRSRKEEGAGRGGMFICSKLRQNLSEVQQRTLPLFLKVEKLDRFDRFAACLQKSELRLSDRNHVKVTSCYKLLSNKNK